MSATVARPGESGTEASGLTHIDDHGRAHMVDVTAKQSTQRLAVARCAVVTTVDTADTLTDGGGGLDAVEAARVAGVQAAKLTSSLIPLCHPIRIDGVSVTVAVEAHRLEVSATTQIVERTGVEMEALTACAVAALTLVAALKEADPEVSIEDLTLWHKSGGRSGVWERGGPEGRMAHRDESTTRPVENRPDA